MRLDGGTAFDSSPNGFDIGVRNRCRLASGRYEGMYAWCRQEVQATLKAPFQQYIARKERQGNEFGSVLPIVSSGVEREESLEPLACENPRHRFFMLVPCINRVPTDRRIEMIVLRVH